MVVYPDGCFYGNLNEESLEKIAESHLLGNQALSEFMIPEKD
jgi:(2Fe-2S) ferredoxin